MLLDIRFLFAADHAPGEGRMQCRRRFRSGFLQPCVDPQLLVHLALGFVHALVCQEVDFV